MRYLRHAIVFTTLFAVAGLVRAEEAKPGTDAKRWEKEVAAIEKRDADNPPPADAIVFVGSSTIRMWKLDKSFPGKPVVNHGFGGSFLSDSVVYFDRLVPPVKPRLVVLYAGDNDLGAGRTPEQVVGAFEAFRKKHHDAFPDTRLVYIGIKASPKRWALIEKIRATNDAIRKIVESDKSLSFVDLDKPLLGADGEPRPELFREDRLHLSDAGYRILADLVRPLLPAGAATP